MRPAGRLQRDHASLLQRGGEPTLDPHQPMAKRLQPQARRKLGDRQQSETPCQGDAFLGLGNDFTGFAAGRNLRDDNAPAELGRRHLDRIRMFHDRLTPAP